MNFSPEWEAQYKSSAHLSRWPWSDLVSAVHRHAPLSAGYKRVLELGCGAGANIPFFQAVGFDYHAIEGSASIVTALHQRFPELADRIVVGDFTLGLPFSGDFDLVVDRSSLISNTTEAMLAGLRLAHSRLRAGGKFIAIDWFSDAHAAAREGVAVDTHTRTDFPPTSDLAGIGRIHFCDREHLFDLMGRSGFEIEVLDHKTVASQMPQEITRAWWNFVATKR